MNFEQTLKEFNDMVKHGQELIEKLKQAKEPVKEADGNDIDILCKFWNDNLEDYALGKLYKIYEDMDDYPYCIGRCYFWYKHCRRLTPAEVAEITGYKVEE